MCHWSVRLEDSHRLLRKPLWGSGNIGQVLFLLFSYSTQEWGDGFRITRQVIFTPLAQMKIVALKKLELISNSWDISKKKPLFLLLNHWLNKWIQFLICKFVEILHSNHNISWLHGNILGESQKFLKFCYSFKEFSGMANKYIGCPFCVLDVSVCSQFVPRHILLQNMFFVNDAFQGKC